jgi:peptidyl-prolyl cis-trans isomerase B (cyclophilin B)
MAKADKRARKRANQQQAAADRAAAAKRATRMRQLRFGGIGVVVVVAVVAIVAITGSDDSKDKKKVSTKNPTTTTKAVTTATFPVPPVAGPVATITTNYGTIKVRLDTAHAPKGANHFVDLIKQKFYDGLTFHRASKNFVIQGGDPKGDGSGVPKSTVVAEVPTNHYPLGSIAAAKTGTDPAGTFGNQFFIVTGSNGSTLPNDYARFGGVISGLDVAQKIEALAPSSGDGPPTKPVKIDSITVSGA